MRFCSDVDFIARAANFALFVACGIYLVVLKNANFPSFFRRKILPYGLFLSRLNLKPFCRLLSNLMDFSIKTYQNRVFKPRLYAQNFVFFRFYGLSSVRCGKLGVWVFSRFIVLADLLNSIRSSVVLTSLGSFCNEYLKISAAAIASLSALW